MSKKILKRILGFMLTGMLMMFSFAACGGDTDENGKKPPVEPPVIIPDYINEPDSGEGYAHILTDRKFTLGFGAEWNLGMVYSVNSVMRKGFVTHYKDIGEPFYILPLGLATEGPSLANGMIKSSGLEDTVSWQFEEGPKKNFKDQHGVTIPEMNEHRLVVKSDIEENTADSLIITQTQDYLHDKYPESYPSDPKKVKSLISDRKGKMIVSYNSYNDISNTAYAYTPNFANNTWPHLLLHQSFREDIEMSRFSKVEFSMKLKLNKAEQINNWPKGASDRADQPPPPQGAPVSNSETTLNTYFFIRHKTNPYLGAFVGVMLSSSNEALKDEYFGVEQNGISFYRMNLGNEAGAEYFDFKGQWLDVGDSTTLSMDLVKFMQYVLLRPFDCENPDSPWYGTVTDDIKLSFFNVGYEYIGNWDCEFEMSDVYARGILK